MDWIRIGFKAEPEIKDLPFITYGKYTGFEVWEDSDWFQELSLKEQYKREFWARLIRPTLK